MDFVWRAGVHVTGSGLWCDAPRAQSLCFLSSAQVLHGLRQLGTQWDALLCSERTWRLYSSLTPQVIKPSSLLLSPPGRPFQLGTLRLELFPSGGLPGATALWLRLPSGREVAYAGAPNPSVAFAELRGCETMQVRPAEALVCHAPLAAVDSALPSLDEAWSLLRGALATAQAQSALVVLLCPPLSTAPALVSLLAEDQKTAELPLYGHPLVLRACKPGRPSAAASRALGQRPRRFVRPLHGGAVLLWPLPTDEPMPPLTRLCGDFTPQVHVILCSGAALLPDVVAACRASLAASGLELRTTLPFPDLIDKDGLLRYVADAGARRLYLTAGYSESLAAALRQTRTPVQVEPLGPPRQLGLFG